jgi:hypothetical protein
MTHTLQETADAIALQLLNHKGYTGRPEQDAKIIAEIVLAGMALHIGQYDITGTADES